MKFVVLKLPELNSVLGVLYEKDSDIEYAKLSMKAVVVENSDYHKIDVIIGNNGQWNFNIETINNAMKE